MCGVSGEAGILFHAPADAGMQKQHRFSISGLEIVGGAIGEGSFGTVFKARSCTSTTASGEREKNEEDAELIMACKLLVKVAAADPLQWRCQIQEAMKEVDIMHMLTSAATLETPIVQMRGLYTTDDGLPCLAMELCHGGNLLDEMKIRWAQKKPMTGKEAAPVLYAVTKALQFCQENRVLHMDVKPENILFGEPGCLDLALLADFGLAIQVPEGYNAVVGEAGRGTPGYMAPEVEVDGVYSGASDVWSLGAVLLEMLTGQFPPSIPWQHVGIGQEAEELLEQRMMWEVGAWQAVGEMGQHLILGMLAPHPCKRLTLSQDAA